MIEQIRSTIAPTRETIYNTRYTFDPTYGGHTGIHAIPCICRMGFYVIIEIPAATAYLHTIPWVPVGSALPASVNEIVTGEESDIAPDGARVSTLN